MCSSSVYLCDVRVRRLAIDPVVMGSTPATGHIRCVLLVNQSISVESTIFSGL